jgi:cephalosporin-C deacetylase-like acetyl esterase
MNRYKISGIVIAGFFLLMSPNLFSQIVLITPGVESKLYLGDSSSSQPLIVGLGGSEGGNAWAGNYWKNTRDEFLKKGYAFLAIGYFKAKGTPDTLDRIAIEKVHNAISEAAKNPAVNKNKIAIIGGSRGGDLALLVGSYFKDIKAVVAIVPSHVAFPGNTDHFTTSSWTYKGKELPFVPVSEEAVPALMKHDLRSTFEIMLKDSIAEQKAIIKIEKINGPVLLMSATKDEVCPSTPMCERMIARLKTKKFKYHYEHIAIEGTHSSALKHFNKVFNFLEKYFGE